MTNSTITNEILESYLACRLKGHLKLVGEKARQSDYERLLLDARKHTAQLATERLLTRFPGAEDLCGRALSLSLLRQGLPLILNATIEYSGVFVNIDALVKTSGLSQLGKFHYIPFLFDGANKPQPEHKTLLQILGQLLAERQGRAPATARLVYGIDASTRSRRLDTRKIQATVLLRDLADLGTSGTPPQLRLNGHCPICEFYKRCRDHAIKVDDLSLLRGLGEKEIAKLQNKGIFTITQLSYTFRPRRRRGQGESRPPQYNASLQALAVRTATVYVVAKPQIPWNATRIYLDIEGIPDRAFYYLIGLRIVKDEVIRDLSFWADDNDDEQRMWASFLAEVATHDEFGFIRDLRP